MSGTLLRTPPSAAACSLRPASIGEATAQAEVIVVGTVVAASESVATLQVDEQWQGAPLSPTITINNHGVDRLASPSCATRPAVGHVTVGNRFVAFLIPNTEGAAAWRFGGAVGDAFIVVDNTDHDRRFFLPYTTGPVLKHPLPDLGSPSFFHPNLGYAESSTVATIKQDWQVGVPMYVLVTTIQALTTKALQR